MKKIILILTVFLSVSIYSQEIVQKESIETLVDKPAELEGGLNAFRSEFSKNFNSDNLPTKSGIYETKISFIVDENGIVSDVKAVGKNTTLNKEAINAVKKIKKKWSPAMSNGKAVKSFYNFPFSMSIQ